MAGNARVEGIERWGRPERGRPFPAFCSHVYGSEHRPEGADRPGSVSAAQASLTVSDYVPRWVEVAGGLLPNSRWQPATLVEDLRWTNVPVIVADVLHFNRTPDYCAACACLPLTGITWPQAAQTAEVLGGRLPASAEWEWMAGRGKHRYPWGEQEPTTPDTAPRANLRGIGPDAPTPVAAFPAGATMDGIFDVAGNVWEWTSTPTPGGGYVIRGGSYRALSLYTECTFSTEVPLDTASRGIGLRVVRRP